MSDLVRYDAMCVAIAECHRIDEVKDMRDKAMALEMYAKQARNTDAERLASEVRLRAERRTGELLKDLPRTEPQRRHASPISPDAAEKSPYAKALAETGISTQTASRYQALAAVPSETFEAALRDPEKPTTSGLLAKSEAARVVREAVAVPQIDEAALWIWGRAREFERDGFANKDPAALLAQMTESMQASMARTAPLMAEFFTHMAEATHELA